jgi:hypothetical protein
LTFNSFQGTEGRPDAANSNKKQKKRWEVCGPKEAAEVAIRFAGGCYRLFFGCLLIYGEGNGSSFRLQLRRVSGPTLVGLGLALFLFPHYHQGDCENNSNRLPPLLYPSHGANTVSQKYHRAFDK